MRRLLVAGVLGVLALPGAAAASLNELPFAALPDRDAAGCLRPTGAPGGLALFARPASTDLWQAGASGLARGEGARLGRLAQCAAAAEAGDHAVVAGVVRGGEVRAAIRDGAGFSAAAELGSGPNPQDAVAAVSPAGHAAVAWLERRGRLADLRQRIRIVVARRLPGQAFSAPERLTRWFAADVFEQQRPGVGIDAGGTTTVVWSRDEPRQRVSVAHAAPGAAFAAQRLGAPTDIGLAPAALAVAPDGWSLVVRDAAPGLAVFERAPGAASFSRVALLLRNDAYDEVEDPAVAIGDGGGAVVTWRTGSAHAGAGVAAITRAPGGSFRLPETVAASRARRGPLVSVAAGGAPPFDAQPDRLRAVLGPGGRALLAWTVARDPISPARARAAAGTLGGSFDPAQAVSSPLRDAEAPAPLFLPDGRAAVAWLDNASFPSDGRLHLAVEGAPAPATSAPVAGLRARRQRLFRSQPLTVTARCDRACDVQAKVRGARFSVSASLLAAGSVELKLPIARPGLRTVDLRASEPGGRTLARRSVRVRVDRRPPLPLWPPLDVRAERRGDEIVVRWRTAGPARRMIFYVLGQRTRSDQSIVFSATTVRSGRGRERFSVRLRPDRPRRVRWVVVRAGSFDRGGSPHVLVPVR